MRDVTKHFEPTENVARDLRPPSDVVSGFWRRVGSKADDVSERLHSISTQDKVLHVSIVMFVDFLKSHKYLEIAKYLYSALRPVRGDLAI